MSCLTVIQDACKWLALPVPTAAVSSTDVQVVQLLSLLNEEGVELRKWPDHNWRKLTKQKTFDTVAAEVQTSAIPADFDYYINDTMWDRTTIRQVIGPLNPQDWQREKAGPTFTSVYYGMRFRGNDLLLTPTPTAGDDIYYEYSSTYWVCASGSETPTKAAATVDTDTFVFPETILSRGVRWRFLRAKGLDYAEEFARWTDMVQTEVARDGGAAKLNAGSNFPESRMLPNIPEGNWPSS